MYHEGHRVILSAILKARQELMKHEGQINIDSSKIFDKLITLYACLDIEDLLRIVRKAERDSKKRVA